MPAAAAEAPAGSHQVFATKKYVLTSVICQITMCRTRPIARDLRSGFQSLPREACPKFQKRNAENSNRGEYITAFSQRKRLLASIYFLLMILLFGKRSKSFPASSAKTHCRIFLFLLI